MELSTAQVTITTYLEEDVLPEKYHSTFVRVQSTFGWGSIQTPFKVPTLISLKLTLMISWFLKENYLTIIRQRRSEYIYVICRLGGTYDEKLWPRAWKCCPRRPRPAFSRPRLQLFTVRTDLSRQITCLFFSCSKLVLQPITNGFVYATLSLNWLARRLLTICKKIFVTEE